jgi:hypothetical protein
LLSRSEQTRCAFEQDVSRFTCECNQAEAAVVVRIAADGGAAVNGATPLARRTTGAEDAPSSLYVLAGQSSAAALLQVMQNRHKLDGVVNSTTAPSAMLVQEQDAVNSGWLLS